MIVTGRKAHTKLKNKTKASSYKKQTSASHEQMELETVIFQYTLDAKQAAYSQAFCNCIQDLQNNLTKLLKPNNLAKDAKFLRICALIITELYYKAKHYPLPPRIKKNAKQIIELLTTDFQNTNLIQAARLFSEQNPQGSDLSTIFTQISLDKMAFLNQFGFKLTSECLI
ncbi:hypothetical protein [Candidatus Rhabdochlamydia porcellionis]|jgi:hypothetical protein|uniref:Uncharacterized protein n=1 Tax=Candidatus Rhabdochlamydia porcellionis TaxID=225148 RepID=A0ABX8Z2N6_9BACT|nr:hypothetical protein [Candidatus Rhabdochlamydia porcellionis]QZA58817.1 hypothetical protein RHAB15C_0000696 [Candidatus Rhabdochlamydia porcellionis]